MKKEDDALRIIEEPHVIAENGWIKLSPLLMKSLGIEPGDMISFIADEQGFRVRGGKKPPYFHAATERPPSTPSVPPQQAPPKRGTPLPTTVSLDVTQTPLFGADVPAPRARKRRARRR